MLLRNVYTWENDTARQIQVAGDKIQAIMSFDDKVEAEKQVLFFDNAIAFPGLINSHDHLDFNLFPALGSHMYNNYKEWGNDIHQQFASTIQNVLKVPLAIRTQWGLYKNLLNGITRVINHGDKLNISENIISVSQESFVLHSVQFENNWKWKLNNPFLKKRLLTIHVGEGTDELARHEIDELLRWNIYKRKIVGIHGVAMTEEQARLFKALVWCPASNYFLLNTTAAVDKLKKYTAVLFGTDSTLTAPWNLWDQLRLAKKTELLSDAEIMASLTTVPAQTWGLAGEGMLKADALANIVVAKRKLDFNSRYSFWDINPQDILLVLLRGNILLFDENLLEQMNNAGFDATGFSKICYDDQCKFVKGNLTELVREIKSYYPDADIPFSC